MQIIQQVFTAYGVRTAAVVLMTVLAVNLIKKPIYRKAESLLEKKGYDKSVITRYATMLPVPVALLIDFVFELIALRGAVAATDVAAMLTRAVVNGGLAVAVYESVKKQLQAYAAKKTPRPEPEPEPDQPVEPTE